MHEVIHTYQKYDLVACITCHIFVFCTISWWVPIIPELVPHRLCNDMLHLHTVSIRDRSIVVFIIFRWCLTLHFQPVEQWAGVHRVQHGSWVYTATGHLRHSQWTAFFKLSYSWVVKYYQSIYWCQWASNSLIDYISVFSLKGFNSELILQKPQPNALSHNKAGTFKQTKHTQTKISMLMHWPSFEMLMVKLHLNTSVVKSNHDTIQTCMKRQGVNRIIHSHIVINPNYSNFNFFLFYILYEMQFCFCHSLGCTHNSRQHQYSCQYIHIHEQFLDH